MKLPYSILVAGLIFLNSHAHAQDQKKLDFNVRAGFSIGGASPVGFPESIRKIRKYNPGLLLSLEAGAEYHFSKPWALASAVRFEQKGMTTEAQVKGYYTTFNAGDRSGDQSVTGYYTGNVETTVRNSYITVPVHLIYKFNSPLSVRMGGFASWILEKNFDGFARDGYIRDKTPVGEKEEISEAAYDFSDKVRNLNAGIELGAGYKIRPHLTASVNFSWGLTPLMKSDFQSIDFKMYNLFANLGLVYHFQR